MNNYIVPEKKVIIPKKPRFKFSLKDCLAFMLHRPLSSLTVLLALALILYPIYQILKGVTYFQPLDYIDQTTLVMLGILLLRAVFTFSKENDLQAVCLGLVAGLSFIYTFEAIYKWSFYISPLAIPAAEMRALVIQIGTALTGLVGFAFGRFKWNKYTTLFAVLFVALWAVWLGVGFPQIFDTHLYQPVWIPLSLSHNMVYLLNRVLKGILCLMFFAAMQAPAKPVEQPKEALQATH